MTIRSNDAEVLRQAGFIDYEIEQIAKAKAPDGSLQPHVELSNPVWQRALESRRRWIEAKIDRAWTESEIRSAIMAYYQRDSKRNPFDFLKAEYKPPLRKDFHASMQGRAQRMIEASFKGYKKR